VKRLLLVALVATSARAATFLVPSDRELVKGAKAIVVATAGDSAGRRAPGGWIETVTALHVDEAIKGPLAAGETIHVTELGGKLGSLGYFVPGSPTYAPGERVLLFLDTNARGEWVSKAMAVGKFSTHGDRLLRAQLCGWNYDGTAHDEPVRSREKFLGFVREVARGGAGKEDYVIAGVTASASVDAAAPLPSSYALRWSGAQGNLGLRWSKFPASVVFYSHGTQPGALSGGVAGVQRALSAWTNDGGSNIVYTYGGTTPVGSAGFAGNTRDGTNSIQFNDPADEIPGVFNGMNGDVLGVGGGWFDDASIADTHTFGGERFYTIFEADLVLQNGIFGAGISGNGFDHLVTHELGHTIGLRHSDEVPAGGTGSASAIMASSVAFNSDPYGSNLQQWDRDAIGALYGTAASPDPCKPPAITGQPQPATLGSQPVTLTVSAIGDAPLRYQWYTGARSNTANPVNGATNLSVNVQPAVTTVYWCRVSNGCEPSVDSAAATVTVNGCPAVTVDSISPNAEVVEGTTVTLTATSTGATALQWYRGASGTTTSPLAGMTTASIDVTPTVTTTYWMRASNGCGAFSNSETVFVTVRPCTAPAITAQPGANNVVAGNSLTFYAGIDGSQPLTILWYEGARGDTSHPVPNGTSPLMVTPPLFLPTSFWVRATNLCGTVSSAEAPVGIVTSCTAPAIAAQPHDASVPAGKSALLTVAATGTALTYQWYQGPILDFNRPLGGSAPSLTTGPITASTQFWVRIAGQCGIVNSAAANVTVAVAGKRRAAGR
jgi:hypothetical protein